MKVSITTIGSRGDLQPFLALGLGLKKAGYEVQIVTAKNEKDFVKTYGLDIYPLEADIQKLMESSEVQEMSKGNNPLKFFISHMKGSKTMKELMLRTQEEIYSACSDADIIIYHPGTPIGFYIAKEFKKKSILVNPFPVISTENYPSILFYTFPRLGKGYNLLTHYVFDKIFWSLSKPALKEFWTKNIQKKVDFNTSPTKQQKDSGLPVLNAYSQHLFRQDENWSKNIVTTGSWFIEEDGGYIPPVELEKFINSGEPPLYIGFGSMRELNSFEKTLNTIIEAVNKTNQRAIVGLGWTKNNYKGKIPENIYLIESLPFTWLFPKMKMVIHHGGAGTTATGLSAGKPTIIIPHNADQPAWGQRVYELKVGAKPIPKNKLTVKKLAEAINYALQPAIIENAKVLRAKMREENGVQKAIEIINKMTTDF